MSDRPISEAINELSSINFNTKNLSQIVQILDAILQEVKNLREDPTDSYPGEPIGEEFCDSYPGEPARMIEGDFLLVTTIASGGVWKVLFVKDYNKAIAEIQEYSISGHSQDIVLCHHRAHSIFDIKTGRVWNSINRIWEKMTWM